MKTITSFLFASLASLAFGAPSVSYQVATNIAAQVVTNEVAPWAMHGQPKPEGDAITSNVVMSIVNSEVGGTNAVKEAVATVASAPWSAKQDKLPYETNAIPAGVITNALWLDEESDPVWTGEREQYQKVIADYTNTNAVYNIITNTFAIGVTVPWPTGTSYDTLTIDGFRWNGAYWEIHVTGTYYEESVSKWCVAAKDDRAINPSAPFCVTNDDVNATVITTIKEAFDGTVSEGLLTTRTLSASALNPFGLANLRDIAPNNATFSNAVLAVGLNVDTNTVAAINAMIDLPIDPTTGATSIGTLLLALAAAVAWLKRNKANISDFTIGSFASYVSTLFTRVDTSAVAVDGLLNNAELEKSVKVCTEAYGGVQHDTNGYFIETEI